LAEQNLAYRSSQGHYGIFKIMNLVQVLILSLVQGITEFLPVSSSGHLVIFQKLFGLNEAPILFDVLLHIGTLISIVFYFRKSLFSLLKFEKNDIKLIALIVFGTIPAMFVGFLAKDQIEAAFNSLKMTGISFLITALFLFSTRMVSRLIKVNKGLSGITWLDALIVGIFQAIAILPGVSRSGSTITGSLWRGLSNKAAFVFSFYLAIPAILGAAVLNIKDVVSYSSNELMLGLIGLLVSAVIGYFALRTLEGILKSAKLWYFGFYCLVLGIIILLI
jgi:undecaprenyl-diphosphatase